MTTAEWITEVKNLLAKGQSYGLTNTLFYAYLNRAKREVERKTLCMFKADVPIITTAGTGSYDLSSSSVIQLTTGCNLYNLKKIWYKNCGSRLTKVQKSVISAWNMTIPQSGYPNIYSITPLRTTNGVQIWLDLFPAPGTTITDFSEAVLKCNILETAPDVNGSQDPLTPPEIDNAVILKACALICHTFVDPRRVEFEREYLIEKEILRNYYNDMSSGEATAGIAL